MFEPDSLVLIILLVIVAAGLIAVAVRYRPLAVRIAAGTGSLVLAMAGGVLTVNHYFGYYQTWSQLTSDLTGSYSAFAAKHATATAGPTSSGRLVSLELRGARSGINRRGYVYLPPQYFERRYAHTRFPVVELIHGSPGTADNWLVQINIVAAMNKLLAAHLVGPMILVLPNMNDGRHFEECVNAPGALDETYISRDVPNDVRARFRASTVPAEWGIAGYSSGGYCAANLALKDPTDYGAAGIMDGYYRPTDGPAAAALHHDPAAEAANNPLLAAQHLTPGSGPLPALWVAAGSGFARDYKGAQAFIAALHGVQTVAFVNEPGAGHNYYTWRPAVPRVLSWMWTAIAPPQLRVQFPLAGPVTNSVVVAPKPPTRKLAHGGSVAASH
jgi:enterochelin esterase-like enzyme